VGQIMDFPARDVEASVKSEDGRSRDRWLRLQAVQVIAMLPENEEEALRILAYAQELLQKFIIDRGE
jgi:hypothetical protein